MDGRITSRQATGSPLIVMKHDSYFDSLGMTVGNLWAQRDYRESDFSSVATEALSILPPSQHVSWLEVVRLGLMKEPMLAQHDLDAKFGQPPLTVYWGRDFRIDVLFWVDGVPDIHQHDFSGAFCVLHGSSLHVVWGFETTHTIATRLSLGTMILKSAEILNIGEVRSIVAGCSFIHATFHLHRPSVTCVIRTNRELKALPQYSYLPPTIAHTPGDVQPSVVRRAQLLRMLIESGHWPEFFECVSHTLEGSDSYSALYYLFDAYRLTSDDARRDALLRAAERKHGLLVDALRPALQEHERRLRILALHRRVTNTDLRFFLAILLNVPSRTLALQLISKQFEQPCPTSIVIRWITELSALGAMDIRWPDIWLLIIDDLLAGYAIDVVVDRQASRFQQEAAGSTESDLKRIVLAIRDFWLFRPILELVTTNQQPLALCVFTTKQSSSVTNSAEVVT